MSWPLGGGDTRIRLVSSGVLAQPKAGDVLNARLGKNIVAGGYTVLINRGSGFTTLTTQLPYTLQAADIPAVGGTFPIYVTGSDLSLRSDTVNMMNPPIAPAVLSRPTITGSPTVGNAATATAGTYSGTPTPTVVRTWWLNGVQVATAASYTPTSTGALYVRETATNSGGSVFADSDVVQVAALPEPAWVGDSYEVRSAVAANATRDAMLSTTRTASYIWNPPINTQTMEYALVNQPNINRNPPSGTYTSLPPGTQDAFTADDAGKQLFVRVAMSNTKPFATLTSSGLVATVTFAQPHGLSTNDVRSFEASVPAGYNISNVRITVVDPTTIQYPLLATQAAATTLGYMFLANEVVELTRGETK